MMALEVSKRAPTEAEKGESKKREGSQPQDLPISNISGEQGWTSLAEPVAFQTKPLAVAR